MSNWIDITMGVSESMAVWPGNDQPKLERTASYAEGADSITSNLTMNLHDGTHCDAPLHFIEGGATGDTIDLDTLMGSATVIEVGLSEREITADILEKCVPQGTERLLIKSGNSCAPRNERKTFDKKYASLTSEGAQWVVDSGVRLVGIDYLSIALCDGPPETHRVLMRHNVQILEGLVLDHIEPGAYELRALPLLIFDAEAAPTRALLRSLAK